MCSLESAQLVADIKVGKRMKRQLQEKVMGGTIFKSQINANCMYPLNRKKNTSAILFLS